MSGKRSNGEGTLRKRPNGLWECSMMIGYHDDGRRRYKSFYGKTQKEAKDKAEAYKRDVEAGLYIDPNLTFQDWSQQWYDGYRDRVSPTTYEGYGYTLKLLQAGLGPRKLSAIKPLKTFSRTSRPRASPAPISQNSAPCFFRSSTRPRPMT